jgi:hypothetical protein
LSNPTGSKTAYLAPPVEFERKPGDSDLDIPVDVDLEDGPGFEPTKFQPVMTFATPPLLRRSLLHASRFPTQAKAPAAPIVRHDSLSPMASDPGPIARTSNLRAVVFVVTGGLLGLALALAVEQRWRGEDEAPALQLSDSPPEATAPRHLEVPAAPVVLTSAAEVSQGSSR